MKKVSPKTIRAGKTLYVVYSLRDQSYIETVLIRDVKPEARKNKGRFGSGWFKGQTLFTDFIANVDSFSFVDRNIFKNSYNDHKCFFSRRKAEAWLKRQLMYPSQKSFLDNHHDYYWMDDMYSAEPMTPVCDDEEYLPAYYDN